MKKITICFVLTTLLFACKKTGLPVSSEQEIAATQKSGKSVPTVTTTVITYLTSATATTGGNVSTSGGGSQATERGVCYKTSPYPTVADTKVPSGSGSGDFICILSGLSANTTYYVKAYAINNSTGVTYGNQIVFATLQNYGTVADYDGNIYNTITIGAQTWTIENLKTTHYRDGTAISLVTDGSWNALSTGAYCNYNNDGGNVATYGRLYNWYAATDVHNIAPAGWHLPSYSEWNTLVNYLGGESVSGGKAKEAGLAHWFSPNTGADNSSGFTALPGGAGYYRSNSSSPYFAHLGYNGVWWTSTSAGSDPNNAWFRETDYSNTDFYRGGFCCFDYYSKKNGYSIRLVKD